MCTDEDRELAGSCGLYVALQRIPDKITTEDKASWKRTVKVVRGQYGVHMDTRTAYQHSHDLQYDNFGSVRRTIRGWYLTLMPICMESILWNKSEVRELFRASIEDVIQTAKTHCSNGKITITPRACKY